MRYLVDLDFRTGKKFNNCERWPEKFNYGLCINDKPWSNTIK